MSAEAEPRLVLRRLGEDDAAEYRAFRLRALRDAPGAFTSTFEEEDAKPLAATVTRLVPSDGTRTVVLGAFDPVRGLIGSAGLRAPSRLQERHKGTLFGMAVAPHAAGRGVGRALVERILETAAEAGLVQVDLTVSEGNVPAERLYRACGFEVWGREPRALLVGGRPVAKLHMVRMLDGADG
ncbi:GNAT family N-acetyltransferase [Actinomadura fibrosa]|uniref:GNAT family N-acetyltransferase n=1 Tax=Actinomadura fibrosa TaxID=111802 RepID=A0ABW2XZ63_9ACTN|nr:GNAT family N-acetyltransferase [Actinomadura fibrosa]